jgi:DNA-binding NarL/FixJ family response regulator
MSSTPVRWTVASDGAGIAFSVRGQGPWLVHMPNGGVSNLEADERLPDRRRWIEALAEKFRVVTYDMRGQGRSEREVGDVSPAAMLLDLAAVVGTLEIERFALFGFLGSSSLAALYAEAHRDSVTHLLLWPADMRDWTAEETRAMGRLAIGDWETFTEAYAHIALGWQHGAEAHMFAMLMRESITQAQWLRVIGGLMQLRDDAVRDALAKVEAPALIMQRHVRHASERIAWMAAALRHATVHIFDGEETVPYQGDSRAVADVMARFVSGRELGRLPPPPAGQTKQRANRRLTPRETEVLALIACGRTNSEIARELVLSVRTVERHIENIYAKIGATGKAARAIATAYALTQPRAGS